MPWFLASLKIDVCSTNPRSHFSQRNLKRAEKLLTTLGAWEQAEVGGGPLLGLNGSSRRQQGRGEVPPGDVFLHVPENVFHRQRNLLPIRGLLFTARSSKPQVYNRCGSWDQRQDTGQALSSLRRNVLSSSSLVRPFT